MRAKVAKHLEQAATTWWNSLLNTHHLDSITPFDSFLSVHNSKLEYQGEPLMEKVGRFYLATGVLCMGEFKGWERKARGIDGNFDHGRLVCRVIRKKVRRRLLRTGGSTKAGANQTQHNKSSRPSKSKLRRRKGIFFLIKLWLHYVPYHLQVLLPNGFYPWLLFKISLSTSLILSTPSSLALLYWVIFNIFQGFNNEQNP